MVNALVGFSGFVGSTLLRQTSFDARYRSKNIDDIRHREFELVVCAGAPAKKWLANREPKQDWQSISRLIDNLRTIKCNRFVLISTVDVFALPIDVDERSEVIESELHAYGLHRRHLEKFVQSHFPEHTILRLPGLVGPGLQKNVIFDFLNDNNLQAVDSRNIFQFYPMVNLWFDIQTTLRARLRLVHLASEPISVSTLATECFGRKFDNELPACPVTYRMKTAYAQAFGGIPYYQYSMRETIQAVRAYAQSEPITLNRDTQGAT